MSSSCHLEPAHAELPCVALLILHSAHTVYTKYVSSDKTLGFIGLFYPVVVGMQGKCHQLTMYFIVTEHFILFPAVMKSDRCD